MLGFLAAGILLGLSAGCSPGPLMALVIGQTLRHGAREGIKVAFAPLLTDLPIILVSILLLTRLADFKPLLGSVSILGGIFILCLAIDTLRTTGYVVKESGSAPQSLGKGILVNLLSPHPYLFWVTVGAPTMLKGWSLRPFAAFLFISGFFVSLIGSKVMLALLTAGSRDFLHGRAYGYIMRMLGVALIFFAGVLIRDGLSMLGIFLVK